jgi:hypothetical protein
MAGNTPRFSPPLRLRRPFLFARSCICGGARAEFTAE